MRSKIRTVASDKDILIRYVVTLHCMSRKDQETTNVRK